MKLDDYVTILNKSLFTARRCKGINIPLKEGRFVIKDNSVVGLIDLELKYKRENSIEFPLIRKAIKYMPGEVGIIPRTEYRHKEICTEELIKLLFYVLLDTRAENGKNTWQACVDNSFTGIDKDFTDPYKLRIN